MDERLKLFEDNKTLVAYIYTKNKYRLGSCYIEPKDYINAGYVGLYEAAKRYDPEKGATFSTYAYFCILGKMLNIRRQNKKYLNEVENINDYELTAVYDFDEFDLIRIVNRAMNNHLTDRQKDILKMYYGFYDREYTLKEIGEKYHVSEERVRQIKSLSERKIKRELKEILK